MNKTFTSAILLAGIISLSPLTVHASDSPEHDRGYAGVMGGPIFITSEGGGTQFAYGAHAGYELASSGNTSYSLGLVYQGTSRSEKVQGVTVDETYSIFGGEFTFKSIEGFPFYAGVRLGTAPVSATYTSGNTNTSLSGSSFAWGTFVGASFPISEHMAVGMDLSYVEIAAGTASGSLGKVNYNKASGILALAEFRFTFSAPKIPGAPVPSK